MSYNKIITSDDPQAVLKLAENINYFKNRNEYMQQVNDYFSKNGTTVGCPGISMEQAVELDERVNQYEQDVPYPESFFKNNTSEINRMTVHIDRLQNEPESVYKGWQFKGGKAVINLANSRLQLMFANKPDDRQIAALKQNGFKWAPTMTAWQRQINPQALRAADKLGFVKSLDGKKPTGIQPKAPKKKNKGR